MSASPARAGVVALRVVRQLKRDRRTIGLIVFAPIVLMILFGYALSGDMSGVALGLVDGGGHAALRAHLVSIQESPIIRYIFGYDLEMMDTVGPAILGLVVFFFTFINAAIAFIRERSQGTLEKFMVSPLSRVEMVSGYVLGFSLFTLLQSATTLFVVTALFGVPLRGSALTALAVVVLLGAGALVLGSFFSNFARSEFQVVQFIPLIITPQIVLCGIWWPLQSVPEIIRPFSYILPLTYAAHALRAVMLKGAGISDILYPDLLALGAFFAIFFVAATMMLRREVG
ncbi:MAG: ABC transporter permease [Methanothrix sp.]